MTFEDMVKYCSTAQILSLVGGYANIVTYIAEHGMDISDDDDVSDAIVEVTANVQHYTDEELQAGLAGFRAIQDYMVPPSA